MVSTRIIRRVQSQPQLRLQFSRMLGRPTSSEIPCPKFLELPLHLLSTILAKLDCMHSLGNAILSHSSLYAALCDDPKYVVQSILRNQIPPELMHYAAAAFESNFIDNGREAKVSAMLTVAFEGCDRARNGPRFQKWCLDWMFNHSLGRYGVRSIFLKTYQIPEYDALDGKAIASMFSRTQALVDYFATCFVDERLPLLRGHVRRRSSRDDQPSEHELLRVKRAIYLFQIYCNLAFRHAWDVHPHKKAKQDRIDFEYFFFGSFSPWVNEQLACVHDYFEDVLSRAFDEVAAHDIQWGAKSVDFLAQGKRNKHKQAYLLYGLPFLFQLTQTTSYEQRLQLLNGKGLPWTPVGLAAHLKRAIPVNISRYYFPDCEALGDRAAWTPTEYGKLIPTGRVDQDGMDGVGSGPFRTWLEANKYLMAYYTAYRPEYAYLRKCGYVMWDVATWGAAETLEVRDDVRRWIKQGKRQALIDKRERDKGRDQMKSSWRERKLLYDQGKRGCWEPGSVGHS